jgi:hypothetical protein
MLKLLVYLSTCISKLHTAEGTCFANLPRGWEAANQYAAIGQWAALQIQCRVDFDCSVTAAAATATAAAAAAVGGPDMHKG